jgi:hypothetical protein
MSWVKLFLIVVVVSALAGSVIGLVVWFSGATQQLLSPEHRLLAVFLAAVSLVALWAVPAILYVPLLSLSIPKSMLIAVFQWLLRGFLYLLIIAVVMVVLALIQIYRGTDVRSQLPGSPPVLGRSL